MSESFRIGEQAQRKSCEQAQPRKPAAHARNPSNDQTQPNTIRAGHNQREQGCAPPAGPERTARKPLNWSMGARPPSDCMNSTYGTHKPQGKQSEKSNHDAATNWGVGVRSTWTTAHPQRIEGVRSKQARVHERAARASRRRAGSNANLDVLLEVGVKPGAELLQVAVDARGEVRVRARRVPCTGQEHGQHP